MKAQRKKVDRKSKSQKAVIVTKRSPKIKMAAVQMEESQIPNTAGAIMPNPVARNRPSRRDVREAFR